MSDAKRRATAEATLIAEVERAWRDWRMYITEQQAILAQRQAPDAADDLFAGATAPVRMAPLPPKTRMALASVLEGRRQTAQGQAEDAARLDGKPAPDPDLVFAALLTQIASELDGTARPDGLARVWVGDSLVRFDQTALAAGTTDADYAAAGVRQAGTQRQRVALAGIAGAILVVILLALLFQPSARRPRSTSVPSAQVGSASIPLWDVLELAWGVAPGGPLLGAAPGYPLLVCVSDAAARTMAAGDTVTITGTTAIRTYQVQAGGRDLVLAECPAGQPPVVRGRAMLVTTQTEVVLDATMRGPILVWGADVDPAQIPADRMQIDLTIRHPDAGRGVLILADGTRLSPSRSQDGSDGAARLTYLAPRRNEAQEAGWVLERSGAIPQRLALTIPAPTDRAAWLAQAVQVTDAQVAARPDGQVGAVISLTLTNATDEPLALLPTDLVVGRGTSVWTPPVLAPGDAVIVAITLTPDANRQPLDLAVGAWRSRLTWK